MSIKIIQKFWLLTLCSLLSLYATSSSACTRILIADKNTAVMVGRSMDWNEDMGTNLIVYPKKISRSGRDPDSSHQGNWMSWISQYGSIVATGYEDLTTDGFNEMGLAAHVLWLEETDYGIRDQAKPGLSITQWMQYYLDNFKNVEEAVRFTQLNPIQITPYFHPATKQWGKLHLVLDDASGDSAIFEYINGILHIYHDRNNITVTNDPTYDKQLHNLTRYKVFGGTKPLPGTTSSTHRFVRAHFYTQVLPEFTSTKKELAGILGILNNVAYPYSTQNTSLTVWRVVSDLTNKIYYFQSSENQNLISVHLDHFDLNQNVIKKLDLVNHPEYAGDVSDKFQIIG
ncbi:linear amide C-N hydrolase [Legionella bononiensis]|uniref:Linear amide C-N hydrolase n=1 Tax=Legionella bononiensis TaxID=2793102 RepID=A0ABS1W7L1_9GAMM|nr:linear amide C-N hydrolase [Legionella bononiensis]MBL7480165.1 linear amide C-N hydrolase [Legionella bononiensis]MBL7525320.1 linear amide C-N hydrolase [Legionella bononiensis]MBL7561504.1 linear amide C-N hydrolase [Legionella bononiensis]